MCKTVEKSKTTSQKNGFLLEEPIFQVKTTFKKDLKMENESKLKPFDKVLVRDKNTNVWRADIFEKYEGSQYQCITTLWKQCIPYEGNEHLLGTTETVEITDLKNGILFGIELKVGYVLEFDNFSHDMAIVIPTTKGLGVIFHGGGWEYLVNIHPDRVKIIRGIINNGSLTGGMLLWQKHNK